MVSSASCTGARRLVMSYDCHWVDTGGVHTDIASNSGSELGSKPRAIFVCRCSFANASVHPFTPGLNVAAQGVGGSREEVRREGEQDRPEKNGGTAMHSSSKASTKSDASRHLNVLLIPTRFFEPVQEAVPSNTLQTWGCECHARLARPMLAA